MDQIIGAGHSRKRELRGLIASAIAEMVTTVSAEQKNLNNYIYRLLECGSIRDKKEYLESRGIIWQPSEEGDLESEDIFDEDEDLQTDEDIVKSMIASSINIITTEVNNSDEGNGLHKVIPIIKITIQGTPIINPACFSKNFFS